MSGSEQKPKTSIVRAEYAYMTRVSKKIIEKQKNLMVWRGKKNKTRIVGYYARSSTEWNVPTIVLKNYKKVYSN